MFPVLYSGGSNVNCFNHNSNILGKHLGTVRIGFNYFVIEHTSCVTLSVPLSNPPSLLPLFFLLPPSLSPSLPPISPFPSLLSAADNSVAYLQGDYEGDGKSCPTDKSSWNQEPAILCAVLPVFWLSFTMVSIPMRLSLWWVCAINLPLK